MKLTDWSLLFPYIFLIILLYLSWKDIRRRYIETIDIVILGVYAISNLTGQMIYSSQQSWLSNIYAALLGWSVFFLIWILTKKRGLGEGELYFVPLAFVNIGLSNAIEALYFAFFSAGIFCAGGIILKLLDKKTPVPFIPFLSAGIIFSLLFP